MGCRGLVNQPGFQVLTLLLKEDGSHFSYTSFCQEFLPRFIRRTCFELHLKIIEHEFRNCCPIAGVGRISGKKNPHPFWPSKRIRDPNPSQNSRIRDRWSGGSKSWGSGFMIRDSQRIHEFSLRILCTISLLSPTLFIYVKMWNQRKVTALTIYLYLDWALPLNLNFQTGQTLYPVQVASYQLSRDYALITDFYFWLFFVLNSIFHFSKYLHFQL